MRAPIRTCRLKIACITYRFCWRKTKALIRLRMRSLIWAFFVRMGDETFYRGEHHEFTSSVQTIPIWEMAPETWKLFRNELLFSEYESTTYHQNSWSRKRRVKYLILLLRLVNLRLNNNVIHLKYRKKTSERWFSVCKLEVIMFRKFKFWEFLLLSAHIKIVLWHCLKN